MIRNLYINEALIVQMATDNKLLGVIKKECQAKEVDSNQLQFVKGHPDIMLKLGEGQELEITTDGSTVKSSIDQYNGFGLSIPTSVENLQFKLNRKRR